MADRPAKRVLVVEDNLDSAESLAVFLEICGHCVAIAKDGVEGLATARSFAPDVIISDLGLPVLDGFGLARAIRADERLRGARLIALSGYDRHEEALAAGFDLHVVKPGELAQLERAVGGDDRARAAAPARPRLAP
jgi:CheY-like chemotaxis protein